MQQERKVNKTAIVFWILTAAVMGLIFFFSAQTADESAEQSNIIFKFLVSVFGSEDLTEFIVRKAAHFSEFALLCFLFNFSFYFTFNKNSGKILSLALTSLYAATDEVHQIFVEGRSCELSDWAIDTLGAAAGLLAFVLVIMIVNACKKRKTEKNEETHLKN